jgi:inhibitor of KinA
MPINIENIIVTGYLLKKINFIVLITVLSNQYNIFPLGDSAATIDLGNTINETLNDKVIAMQQWMQVNHFEGLKDIIVAYSSLTLIYDIAVIKRTFHPPATVFDFVKQKLQQAFYNSLVLQAEEAAAIQIPVCYEDEFGIDLAAMAIQKQMTREEIIQLHTSKQYRVYMIGFLPGFSYMAEVDERLVTPRKEKPVMVAPGSVGIAGSQTGIYPFASPGGWNIIGKTPVKLFDAASGNLVKLKAGDRVQFYAIGKDEMT